MSCDVSITRCESYHPEEVRHALETVLSPLGGLDWVRPGMRIALKANLVAAKKSETAATTHPTVLGQLTRMLTERGAVVVVGDSPGGLFNEPVLRRVYDVTGLHEVEEAGGELNYDFEEEAVVFPQAAVAKTFSGTAWLRKADAIINVCKLKSHGMMSMSAAAKNMFGAIPGTKKPEYHFRFPNVSDFADMIVDLDEHYRPQLNLVDAVIGMEGNGPTQGTPRAMNAILASHSPHAVDLACAEMLGFQPQEIPTLVAAQQRGLIPASAEQLQIAGDLAAFHVENFEKIETGNDVTFKNAVGGGVLGQLFSGVAGQALASHPQVEKKKCIGCAECARICPAKAITMKEKLPVIDRQACIRCFCCQEFCPVGAMKVKRTWIAKILTR